MTRKKEQKKKQDAARVPVLPPVRCTAEEQAAIARRAKSAGLTQSAYLREVATTGRVVVKKPQTDFALVNELRRLGVNLNQLAKVANRTGNVPEGLAATLARMDAVLDAVLPR